MKLRPGLRQEVRVSLDEWGLENCLGLMKGSCGVDKDEFRP